MKRKYVKPEIKVAEYVSKSMIANELNPLSLGDDNAYTDTWETETPF